MKSLLIAALIAGTCGAAGAGDFEDLQRLSAAAIAGETAPAPRPGQRVDSDSTGTLLLTDKAARPLPITGDWALVSFKTYSGEWEGRKPVTLSFSRYDPDYTGRFELDTRGQGFIEGLARCKPKADFMLHSYQPSNAFTALVFFYHAASAAAEGLQCAAEPVRRKSLVVLPHHDWLGRPAKGLDKNLGVFGEGGRSADAECRSLRGWRIVQFPESKTVACVGFSDGSADRLRMLIQPAGEIYVSRADYVRN